MSVALSQFAALSRRSVVNTVRTPQSFIPSLTFPLIFLALNAAALGRSTGLPGFPPVDSFMQFQFTTTVIQGTLFGSIIAGSGMAKDIEDGFFERLVAAPTSRASILVGRLAGAFVLAFFQAWIFFILAAPFGLSVEAGLAGMLAISLVSSVLAAGVGGISVAFALKTGSTEAVQGSFPLLFALMFLSSAFFPRALLQGWFENVAAANPFSYLIEDLRHQVIFGLDASLLLSALGIAAAIFVVGMVVSSLALRARLAETA
jgi:ABC-2 type transport system permease protein